MDGKREVKEWLKLEWKHMACKSFHQHQTVQIVLLMDCPIIPLRVAHVEYWLQFKLVSCNSLSLQTATGIKTLGKSAIDIRNIFFSLQQPLRSLSSLNLLNFFLCLREKENSTQFICIYFPFNCRNLEVGVLFV